KSTSRSAVSWARLRRWRAALILTRRNAFDQAAGPEEPGLEKASNGFAIDAKADHAAGAVDLLDRVRGDQAAAAGEEPGLDRERIGNVGGRAVHRALDLADEATLPVGHDVAGGAAEVDGDCA